MEIENITEEDYLSILPKYQKEIITELISSYGIEGAVDKWLESNGPEYNVQFGGIGNENLLLKYKDTIKKEINKFICGHSKLNKIDNTEYNLATKTLHTCIVNNLSIQIAELTSISEVVIVPVVVLLLIAAKTIGLNSYCKVAGFPRKN